MNAELDPQLNCADVLDAAGVHALGALDPDEADAVDAHLSVCSACRKAFEAQVALVDSFASVVPASSPPPALKSRLLAELGMTAAPSPLRVVSQETPEATAVPASNVVWPRWLMPSLAAAVALLLVTTSVLATLLVQANRESDDYSNTAQLIASYVSSGGQVVTMNAQPASIYEKYSGQGSLITAPGKKPLVVVAGCPESGEFLTYRVWFARAGDRSPAGTLKVGENGSGVLAIESDTPLTEFDTIGVTVILEDEQREDVLVGPLTVGGQIN